MRAAVLFSGGKDSSLAAILLSTWYEVELNTYLFSQDTNIDASGKPQDHSVFRTISASSGKNSLVKW